MGAVGCVVDMNTCLIGEPLGKSLGWCVTGLMVGWLITGLNGCMIGWLIGGRSGWLIDLWVGVVGSLIGTMLV